METINGIKERAKDYEVLSHEFRLFVLKMLKEHDESTWTDITEALEKYSKRRLNPNSVNFHLSRLIESGFIKKKEIAGTTKYILTDKTAGLSW